MTLLAWCVAWILDVVIGDPPHWPHPVRWIGRLIAVSQRVVRRVCHSDRALRIGGGVMWLVVIGLTWGVAWGVLALAHGIHPWLGWLVEVWMIFTALAGRCLAQSAMAVARPLRAGDLAESRHKLSWIVGRDTSQLQPAQINRAVVETVAENTSDGVVAPLLYLAIGGAPLGFFYKAVNTMDSMLGYVEPPYKDIGLVPAKADDIANYLPARISALLMLAAGGLLRMDVKNGWKIFRRDRYKHASPNSAQTESVCAGLLDVRLAGDAWYHGVLHKKEYIGDALRQIEHEDIPRACRLMYGTTLLALLLGCAVRLLIFLL